MEKHKIKWKPTAKRLDTKKFVNDLPFLSTGNTQSFILSLVLTFNMVYWVSAVVHRTYCKKYSTLSKSSIQKITLKLAIDVVDRTMKWLQN